MIRRMKKSCAKLTLEILEPVRLTIMFTRHDHSVEENTDDDTPVKDLTPHHVSHV